MRSYIGLLCKSIFDINTKSFTSCSFTCKTILNNLNNVNKRHNFTPILYLHTNSENLFPLSKRFNENVLKLSDFDEYHNVVYRPLDNDTIHMKDLVVSVFYNRQSTASLSVLDSVNRLSSEFPLNTFLLMDSDVVPRSAYDADVQHFPSALLSYGGDLYRDLVSEESGYSDKWSNSYRWSFSDEESKSVQNQQCVLPEKFYQSVLTAMNKFNSFDGKNVSAIKSRAGTHSYTHGIDTDNLNLKRVGWPTE
uniref:Uncharacterized protein n=1 Tax=Theileria annulata TaxID=5874 RepID=A0A3B0N7T1_THEAN